MYEKKRLAYISLKYSTGFWQRFSRISEVPVMTINIARQLSLIMSTNYPHVYNDFL